METTDLATFKGILNGLIEALEIQSSLQLEMKKLRLESNKIQQEIETLKIAILKDLKQRNEGSLEYKGIKISVHPKPKRIYYKKADKERLICDALQKCGIHEQHRNNVIDAINQQAKEREFCDTLKIKKTT
jgi:hypothetical protein